MAMNKYAEYTKQLRALGREAVRIQKEADRVYAKGCTLVTKNLKESGIGKWVCTRDPYITPTGITELFLLHVTGVKACGTYGLEYRCIELSYNSCLLFRFELKKNTPAVFPPWYINKHVNPMIPYNGKGKEYLYVKKDFSLWITETETSFNDLSHNRYVKKALKYMEDNKL